MLPEKIREKTTTQVSGRDVEISKMMVADAVEFDRVRSGEITIHDFLDKITNIDSRGLTKAELWKLLIDIHEFTDSEGLSLMYPCNNPECGLQTKFPLYITNNKIEYTISKKQKIEIDDITFNISSIYKSDKEMGLSDMIVSAVYGGKLYEFDDNEAETFINEFITPKQLEKLTRQLIMESAIYKFKCPSCGKSHEIDITWIPFLESSDQ